MNRTDLFICSQGQSPLRSNGIRPRTDPNVSTKVDTHQEQLMPFRQIVEICRRRGGSGCGGVSRMGPRHASGGLGRTPNPGLAVCAGQRTRASRDRATWTYLQRPPQPDPLRHPSAGPLLLLLLLLLLRLPASGRHYPWMPGATRPQTPSLKAAAGSSA
ncbi:hypothetical protein D7Y42_00250 [Stenotrophomonas maltophilia]|nr:hypothetical protein [Stenotrophomonas maltophilia]